MAAKSGERGTSFAMACSLLSQYVKQNGAATADLGLGIGATPKGEVKTPTTMNLLPGVGEVKKETMELFPQSAGFGAKDASNEREPERQQLTIFYGGKVIVFDNFPAEKAKDLMQMASKGSSPMPAAAVDTAKTTAASVHRPRISDLPIARRASLQRFLEKKKDRQTARAPYQVSPTSATTSPIKKEVEESQPWLGLSTDCHQ